ncbi:MAG: Response regulator, LuxR family [Candidatus Nitrospira kreftii]|jgi:two-component system invasion response regulator UvrY|uniref:Response regulator, LuxR family n=1 Tax=Candidatus Nitrospira kreftii TaxID=2652173 RepID=A0A7S8IXZ7_9BACT|nr:MAG: Response regulator, LuxR family [Candidatus Nitrospira kreftii]
MLNILIAEDYPLFRLGVKELLTDGLEAVKVGECDNAHDLFELVRRKKWDALILDITIPGTTGTEALKHVKKACPTLPVIVLTMYPEDQYAVRMFKAGADAYLTKASAPEELVKAVKKVLAGGQYVSQSFSEKLVRLVFQQTDRLPHEILSDREYEVMRLLASGKTVSEIADSLHLGTTTISTYRARILEKLNLKNNAELMRYAVQQGVLE